MTDRKETLRGGASAVNTNGVGADSDIRKLMVLAGRRQEPPAEVRARVHASVLNAWQQHAVHAAPAALDRGRIGLYRWPWAIAASLLLVLAGWGLLWSPAPTPVGQLAYASGGYSVLQPAEGGGPESQRYHVGDSIPIGTLAQTADDGYLKIALDQGASLRLDRSTSVTLQNNGHLWLHQGRIYVDSPDRDSQVNIVTPFASVIDVGTQFTVALIDGGVSVVVREGLVNVSLGERKTVSAKAHNGMGEMLHVDDKQRVKREPITTTDLRWNWIHQANTDFDLNASSLYEFLRWACREEGLELHFASQAVELAAKQTRLHGRITGMAPREAIQAVLATTQFVSQSGLAHQLVVSFKR